MRLYFQYRGIAYEYHPVNLVKGEQRTEDYSTKFNPAQVTLILYIFYPRVLVGASSGG